jgi:hypothetical protein
MSLVPNGVAIPEDQRVLLETVREFARDELLPLDREWDREEPPVGPVLPRLSAMGLMGLRLPEDLGGLGCDYRLYAAILHEISVWSPSFCVMLGVHNMVAQVLNQFLDEPLRQERLSGFGQPENFAAFAISEAGAGSDPAASKTTATPIDSGYCINGEKMWITNGLAARWILTLARLEGYSGKEGLCIFLVEGRHPGVHRSKIVGKTGIRASETAVIHFEDAYVPADHLIGPRGQGLQVCLTTLNAGRVGIAAQATGIAEACLDEMVAYARTREQFGQPIGKFQAVGNMIADSAVELEAARLLTWSAAAKIDAGIIDRSASSKAKLFASEAANRIAYRAVQVHGGAGFVRECRVEQLARDARVTTIYEGTSEIQRLVIGSELAAC